MTDILIMAGGIGSRLYPLSTPEHPKQFVDILGTGKSLIRMTYERFLHVDPQARFWILTSSKYIHFIQEQLPEIPLEQVLAEPVARNTAPCIAYACWKIKRKYPDANIVVTPSDAYVPDCEAFARTINTALDFTRESRAIVCIGIEPRSPHTGYGYIQCALAEEGKVSKVEAFKEKPDLQTAQSYLAKGGYWWNAGIFVWNVRTIEAELRANAPRICSVMDALSPSLYTPQEEQALEELFPTCEKISIDYAVMEKSSEVYTTPASWIWSDLGSFEAIEEITGRRIARDNSLQ